MTHPTEAEIKALKEERDVLTVKTGQLKQLLIEWAALTTEMDVGKRKLLQESLLISTKEALYPDWE